MVLKESSVMMGILLHEMVVMLQDKEKHDILVQYDENLVAI
jgi:hypothetical protein